MFRKYRGWIGAVTAIILLVSFAVFADTVSMGLRGAEDISWATGNTGSAETFTQTRQIGTVTRTFTLTKPDATYLKFRKALSGGPYSVEDAIGRFWASDGSPLVFSVDQVGNIFYGSVDITSSTSLSTTITAIGSTAGDLSLAQTSQAGGGLIIPPTLRVKAPKGSTITVATGTTFTVNGPFEAGLYQVFSCTGTGKVVFSSSKSKEVYPEWFGENDTPGTTDMAPAINAAFASISAGTVKLLPTTYYLGSQILVTKSEVHLIGAGKESTKLVYTKNDGTSAVKFSTGVNSNIARCTLRDFRIYGFDGATATNGTGLELVDIALFVLEDLYIEGFKNGTNNAKGIATYGHTNNVFKRVTVAHCNINVYFGENPNAHAAGIDVDYFRFEECIFVNSTSEDGYNVYFDCNYVNNLMFEGCEFAYAKYGLYKSGGFSPSANNISIRGGRCEYNTARADARFIYFNITSNNLYNLSIRDFYSPYPIELTQYVNYVTIDNIYLGADNPGGTAALITGATVGPVTVSNSRINIGTSISGNTIWKKTAVGTYALSDGYFVRSTDANSYINRTVSIPDHGNSGDVLTATAGEDIAIGNLCYLKSDGKYWKAKADAAGTMPTVVMAAQTISANAEGLFLVKGFIRNDDGWGGALTVGGLLYTSAATGGAMTQTPPAVSGNRVQIVGYAYAARKVYFNPTLKMDIVP